MEVGISALRAGILQNDAPRARFEFGTGVLAGWWRCVYSPNFGAFAKVCESSRRLASGVKRIGRRRAYDVSSACWMSLRSNLVDHTGHYLNRPLNLKPARLIELLGKLRREVS